MIIYFWFFFFFWYHLEFSTYGVRRRRPRKTTSNFRSWCTFTGGTFQHPFLNGSPSRRKKRLKRSKERNKNFQSKPFFNDWIIRLLKKYWSFSMKYIFLIQERYIHAFVWRIFFSIEFIEYSYRTVKKILKFTPNFQIWTFVKKISKEN